MGKIVEGLQTSILEFLDAFQQARVPPLDATPDPGARPSTALHLSQLVIFGLLFTIARSVLAGGEIVQFSAAALAFAIALTALLLVGIVVRVLFPQANAPERTQGGSAFVMVYLTLSLILYILLDVSTQLIWGQSLTSSVLVPVIGRLGMDAAWIVVLTVLFFSLLAWGLLMVKTQVQTPSFLWTSAILTIQFPFFALLNAAFLYALVLMPL